MVSDTLNIKSLQEERIQLFSDVYNGIKPKRVPIHVKISWEAAMLHAGYNLVESQWDSSTFYNSMEKVAQDFPSDKAPTAPTIRNPLHYKLLGSKAIVMSKNGYMQHPEVHALEPDEYDEFIADPYKCIIDKLAPRIYTALDTSPAEKAMVLAKAFKAKSDENLIAGKAYMDVVQKYGFAEFKKGGFCEAPYDFIADFVRSFSGISKDVRRCPDKVEAACEAVLPHMIKLGTMAPDPDIYHRTFIPLHMAPFLNNKQFERFYWPTFDKLIHGINDTNTGVDLFVEHDWMRFIDKLESLPGRIEMTFEYGDPKLIKEKINNKHIILGLYPAILLQSGTKEQCVDKAKELIDILAPDGGYVFGFDKVIFSLEGQIASNLYAVLDYVSNNCKY